THSSDKQATCTKRECLARCQGEQSHPADAADHRPGCASLSRCSDNLGIRRLAMLVASRLGHCHAYIALVNAEASQRGDRDLRILTVRKDSRYDRRFGHACHLGQPPSGWSPCLRCIEHTGRLPSHGIASLNDAWISLWAVYLLTGRGVAGTSARR